MTTTGLTAFPDAESILMFALVPMHPDIRFVTTFPAGASTATIARIKRLSGANSNIYVDLPVVDIDVYGSSDKPMDVSLAARDIQVSMMSFAGIKVQNGVIQHVSTVSGPREIPEANTTLVRYNASYEIRIHP